LFYEVESISKSSISEKVLQENLFLSDRLQTLKKTLEKVTKDIKCLCITKEEVTRLHNKLL